jgi:hypothetical protein
MNELIYVGIDDTDTLDSRGTNQLAKALVQGLADDYACVWIVRHQLFFDPRVPFTSQNGSASIVLRARHTASVESLAERLETLMRADFIAGSDPGLCVTRQVPQTVIDFAHRCQRELITQEEARALAAGQDIFLTGLGGTEGGVIGALAAVGLAAEGNDGRVVQIGEWSEELYEVQPLDVIQRRGVQVVEFGSGRPVTAGLVHLGKKLRPNVRDRRFVLFVEASEPGDPATWKAVKLK